eukprot:766347-Hanusia_phi.AAC.5
MPTPAASSNSLDDDKNRVLFVPGMFSCDFGCGFSGDYNTVANHEAFCQNRRGWRAAEEHGKDKQALPVQSILKVASPPPALVKLDSRRDTQPMVPPLDQSSLRVSGSNIFHHPNMSRSPPHQTMQGERIPSMSASMEMGM